MQPKYPLLRLISTVFKILALIIAILSVVGGVAQLAIFFGLFPADFYFNSIIFDNQRTFLPGGIATMVMGSLTAGFWYAFARILDLLMKIEANTRR